MIATAWPPRLDGIGDYSARVAEQLVAKGVKLRVFIPEQNEAPEPMAGVTIEQAFRVSEPRSIEDVLKRVEADLPDWLLLQYNPFSYGRRGWNPYLPAGLERMRKRLGGQGFRLAVMAHEAFVSPTSTNFLQAVSRGGGVKPAIMHLYQRHQFERLGHTADVLFISIDPWRKLFAPRFPKTLVQQLPVGSNVLNLGMTRGEARERLNIPETAVVISLFGTAAGGRMLNWLPKVVRGAQEVAEDVRFLYIGPHGKVIHEHIRNVPVIADGPLEMDEISRRLGAADIGLGPYDDGISSRRTSMMSFLLHGIPFVGTSGESTDDIFYQEAGRSLVLIPYADGPEPFVKAARDLVANPTERARLGAEGNRLYRERFDWSQIVNSFLYHLSTIR